MLTIKDIHVFYNFIHALKGISLEINDGEIVALIGGNGAGKSTTLKSIMGIVSLSKGEIKLLHGGEYKEIQKLRVHAVAQLGVSYVPEGRQIFGKMTVEENLKLGAYLVKENKEIRKEAERIFVMFPRLKERRGQLGSTLSGGEQQMLAIGRALMARPKLLLMDEPSLGLAPLLIGEVFRVTKEINSQGVSILLVEQNAAQALKLSDRGYVLENGAIELSDLGKNLLSNPSVVRAYLGG